MASAKKWASAALWALALVLLAIIVWVFAGLSFFGVNTFNVVNGSMNPTLPIGTKVLVVEQEAYQPDDMITFTVLEGEDFKPLIVTHRLIGYGDDGTLITQGDANDSVDYPAIPIDDSAIIGKVVGHVPLVGGVQEWTKAHPWAWLPFIGALIIVILLVTSKRKPSEEDESTEQEEPALVTTT